ncbi:BRCT domain-containing protein [Lacticaseibacillus thailandensis]|uniref:BRCT domain-containing protein n=1 Tax=Lacticaseibacillus thailandensis TaxID=381741 RepID=UPI00138F5BD5|nr:BRCT domain-containing protein [Lacticaseibacillus thailandensis]
MRIARRFYPSERHNRLKDCIERIHIDHEQAHRALQDCLDTFTVYNYFKANAGPGIFKPTKRTATPKRFDLTTLTAADDKIDTENPFYQRFICFTGKLDSFNRKTAAQAIVNLGGNPQNGVTKQTEYLVLGDTAYSLHGNGTVTSKLKKG